MQSNPTAALPVLLVLWLMVLASVCKTEFVSRDRLLRSGNVNLITGACCVVINTPNFPFQQKLHIRCLFFLIVYSIGCLTAKIPSEQIYAELEN